MAMNLSHEMLLYVNFQSSHWSVYDLGPNSGDLDAGNWDADADDIFGWQLMGNCWCELYGSRQYRLDFS